MTTLFGSPTPVDVSAPDEVAAGQRCEVTVRFVTDRALEVSGGEVELVRTTAVTRFQRQWMGAAGTVSRRSAAVPARVELDIAGQLTKGQQLVRRTTLQVPGDEATIAGHLVQQDYTIRVRIHADGGPGGEGTAAVRVGSSASGRGWVADAAPTVDDDDFAVIGINELSSRRLLGGVPLRGVVTVAPRRAGAARGVRVELVLEERVPAGTDEPLEEDRVTATVVAAERLSAGVELVPGQALPFPFALRIPHELPAPSVSTSEFTLRWLLRAVLDRPMRPDSATTMELWGTTAL
jgi:hypothetical protein